MAPPGFCNRGEVRYGSTGGLEYEVPQSRLYCLCINVALCSTALMYLSCDTKKFHDNESTHILHNFYTTTKGGKLPPSPPGGATAYISGTDAAQSALGSRQDVRGVGCYDRLLTKVNAVYDPPVHE